jgi:flavin-dependent dehydrogenase
MLGRVHPRGFAEAQLERGQRVRVPERTSQVLEPAALEHVLRDRHHEARAGLEDRVDRRARDLRGLRDLAQADIPQRRLRQLRAHRIDDANARRGR